MESTKVTVQVPCTAQSTLCRVPFLKCIFICQPHQDEALLKDDAALMAELAATQNCICLKPQRWEK